MRAQMHLHTFDNPVGICIVIINLVVRRLNIYVGKERMLVFMSSSRLSWPKMRLPW